MITRKELALAYNCSYMTFYNKIKWYVPELTPNKSLDIHDLCLIFDRLGYPLHSKHYTDEIRQAIEYYRTEKKNST